MSNHSKYSIVKLALISCLLLIPLLSGSTVHVSASSATGAYISSVTEPNINVPNNWTPWSNTIRHVEIGRWDSRPRGGDCPFTGPCGGAYASDFRVTIEVGSGGFVSFDWWMRSTVDRAFDWIYIYLLNPIAPYTYLHVPIAYHYNAACPSGYICDPVYSPVFHSTLDLNPYTNKQVFLVFETHYYPTLLPDTMTQLIVDNIQVGPMPGAPYNFEGFIQPIANAPAWNVADAGKGLTVKFRLGGYQGPNIMAAGYPASQEIGCESGEPLGNPEETVERAFSDLAYRADTGVYVFSWKPDKAWAGTCRQLIFQLDDNSTHEVRFHFN